jgi:hypothetical protein
MKSLGFRRACSSIRLNMRSGKSPASSANMQNTSRLMKCATVSEPTADCARHDSLRRAV